MSRHSASASSSSTDPLARNGGADAAVAERRARLLAALDVTVWQQRSEPDAASAEISLHNPDIRSTPSWDASSPAGPAAAMALLQEAQAESASPTTRRDAGLAQRIESTAESASEKTVAVPSDVSSHSSSAVSLWCLASAGGVLISHATGLSAQAQRLLKDVLLAATRIDPAAPAKERFKAQALRFNWPPAEGAAALGAAALGKDASTERALRGFLNRQLKDTPNAFVLYTTPDIGKLLTGAQLDLEPARLISIGGPDLLLGNGAAKRALWQTLNTL